MILSSGEDWAVRNYPCLYNRVHLGHLGSPRRVSRCDRYSGESEEDIPVSTGTGLGTSAQCNVLSAIDLSWKKLLLLLEQSSDTKDRRTGLSLEYRSACYI